MISNALAPSIAMVNCASSKGAMRVPVIHAETADHARKVLTVSASSVSVAQAIEGIIVRR